MKWREQAELLSKKAAEDEFTLAKLIPDPAAPDSVIGFHAQQAVEKWLKAVLNHHQVAYRRTHELTELFDALRAAAVPFPAAMEDARRLTPFAVQFRYDDVPVAPPVALDRRWIEQIVNEVRTWAQADMTP